MKILHVIDSGGLYGAEVMLLNLMAKQIEQGDTPVLGSITASDDIEKAIENRAMELGFQVKRFVMKPGLNLAGGIRVFRYGDSTGVDVYHSHGYKPNILLTIAGWITGRRPLVCSIHGWTNTKRFSKMAVYEWMDSALLRYKDAVVLVSERLLEHRNFIRARVPGENVYVVNNGISPGDEINRSPSSIPEDIKEFCRGSYILGSIGRLSSEKRFSCLVRATGLLRDKDRDIKLIIIGDGPLRDALQEEVRQLQLQDRVLFTGYRDNARRFMALMHLYLISSSTEGLPITLLEAMQEKVPVISTPVGGIPGVIDHGNTGILVEAGTPESLAREVERLIDQPDHARELAENAYRRVEQKYSANTMADSYSDIYGRITEHQKESAS